MTRQDAAGHQPHAGRRSTRPVFWTGLVLVAVATVALNLPRHVLEPDQRRVLDPAQVEREQDLAWIVPFDADVPSNKDGHSPVRMFEDGVELTSNSVHSQIREDGGAQFSHWGPWIRFATTDGSDPRSNDREYALLLPSEPDTGMTMAFLGLLSAALVLVSWAGVATARAGATTRAHLVGALAVFGGIGLTGWMHASWLGWSGDLVTAGGILDGRHENVARAMGDTRVGNTTRLLRADDDTLRFVPRARLEAFVPPRECALQPEDGVEPQDDRLRLTPRGAGLVATLSPPLAVRAVAEIVLPVRLFAGERLLVEFRGGDGGNGGHDVLDQIELPVLPAAELQHLQIRQPIVGFVGSRDTLVRSIRLSNPGEPGHDVVLTAGDLVIAGDMAVYGRATHGFERLDIDRSTRPSLWQSVAGEVVVPWPPEGDLLKGSVAVFGAEPQHAVPFDVFLEDEAGGRHPLAPGQLALHDSWSDVRASLPADIAPKSLVLACSKLPAGSVLAWSGWRAIDTSRPPQRVLLTLMDTLRADALACYGADTHTPHLDALAREGVRFANCYSQTFCTRPSMPSIMTARYVESTGVQTVSQRLPPSYTTLAEAFADAGFYTVADISNTNAGPDAGLDQGFDEMKLVLQSPQVPDTERYLMDHVLPHLDGLQEEDLLVYVHLMEAHGPYGQIADPAAAYEPPAGKRVRFDPYLDRPWNRQPTDASRVSLYQADVERMDRGFGEFLEVLLARWEHGNEPDTVVAVLSDHGEFLGEYGQWGHGYFRLVPAINHVPMILRAPHKLPGRSVVDTPIENIDAVPTLLALAGIPPGVLGDVEGQDLLPLVLDGDERGHGHALASAGQPGRNLFSVFSTDGVLVGANDALVGRLDKRGRPRGDPALLPDEVVRARDSVLSSSLQGWIGTDFEQLWESHLRTRGALRRSMWSQEDATVTTLDPVALRHLREMGYLR